MRSVDWLLVNSQITGYRVLYYESRYNPAVHMNQKGDVGGLVVNTCRYPRTWEPCNLLTTP